MFAGREIARALGKLAISAEQCTGEVGDFSEREAQVLADWEQKFEAKYTVVGRVSPAVTSGLAGLQSSVPTLSWAAALLLLLLRRLPVLGAEPVTRVPPPAPWRRRWCLGWR